ncbi:hypothetical protein BDP81DRAFT_399237 [Colletotrichum phormii]|uniref:Reticulocyte-binding protein 2-like protein a n=1 Tax=Colletotrichum phormii TaxID=359342 RepID=A0AAI9ZFX5_9PEZI|nr:uncharacterized protein BDP81DRAFT_399237 [Colletotrichum phormii]KAK1623542.1 hypothetical protein BDP81DRAFT_399237 [Colletotrichum phormii]
MEYNPSPSFGLGARANRRASTQLTIDEEGRKPLFSKPSRESLEPQNPSQAAAGSNRFGYSPTNAQTSATGRPPSRAAIPRPSSSLSQTPSLNSNHSIEIVSPGSRIPRPKSTIGVFVKGSGFSVAEAWKLADENRVQTLEKTRRATPAAIDASPSPAPRPYTNRQVSDESKSRRSLGKDAVDYSRPRPLSRMSSDSLRDSYVGRYGGSPGSNSLSSSGSFDRRLSQYEREMAESPSASRDQDHFFGKTRVGPRIAETGHTLARRTSNSSLNGSSSVNRRASNSSLNGSSGLGRRTSYGSLSASPRPGAFAKSHVPEGHIKELLEQDEKGIKRSASPKPEDNISADTPLPSVERLPQEPTPPTSRPASANPEYRSPDKSYAWQLDADFTAGDLQISDSPRIRTGGAGFSEASDRRSSYGSAYAEEQLLGMNGNLRRESSLGPSPRAGRSNTRIDEIRQREEKAKEELAESRKALPRARNNTRLEEIREREAEAEEQLAKQPRRSYYPTPDDLPDREEVDTQVPPKNTKLDEIRAREAELLSKKAVATSRLEEIREQNSMTRSVSPEARRSGDFARESTPIREAGGESEWPTEDGEHIANTPVTIYRDSPVRERNKSLSETPASRNERASPKPARPLGAHARTDSRDILQRLARAASSSPAPETHAQPATTDEKKRPSIEDLEKERLEKETRERDRLEKERFDRDRLEKERLEREKIAKDRLEKEQLAKETLEKEKLEKERLEKERLDKERLEKEKLEEEKRAKLKLEMERLEKETSKEPSSQRAEIQRRRSETTRSAHEAEPKASPPRTRRGTIKVSEPVSTETKGTDDSKSSSTDELKAPEARRPKSRVDFAARRRERRQKSTDSAKDNRKSVALSDGDPTDRIEQEMNLFAPADNQSERGSRAPSAEPTTEDEDKDLFAGETPRPKKVDPLSLPTPRVTGAYVETPATLKVERIEENTLPPLTRPGPLSNATFDRPHSRRGSRPSSRADTLFKASGSGSETSDQKETAGTSTTSSLRRRNRSTSRPRKPLTNSVKPPTVKDDIMELQRIHQIEDSTLDDFEELFNMQKLQDDPSIDIESMLDDIAVKKEEVAAKPNITKSQRNHELEQYDRMSKTLKDGLFNIRTAKQGIERLEGQVSHAEGKHDVATTLEKVSEKQPLAKGSHHRHNPDHARDCPDCVGQTPVKEVSYLHLPVPSLYHRNPLRLTFLGLVFLMVSLWYAAESAMCEAYCRPTTCSSTPCVWSPTDPTWGVAIPVKLDEWATGGLGRQLTNQYSEEASDLWADALDFVTGTDITTIDINTLDFYDKRQLRRRLRKKGLAKRPVVESASDTAKWDAWHATRVASERAQDAREMGYDIALAFNVQRISKWTDPKSPHNSKPAWQRKPWFGFDLDDTLHEYRRASSAATAKTLEAISQRHGTSLDDLKEAYGHVLRDKTASAFADGKTSFEYRRERFASVLDRFGLPSDDAMFMDSLLDVSLPELSTLPIPQNITFVATPGRNTSDAPMVACCAPNPVQLAGGCYEWCELPGTYDAKKNALSTFGGCLSANGKNSSTDAYIVGLHVANGAARPGVTTVGLGMFVLVVSLFVGLT